MQNSSMAERAKGAGSRRSIPPLRKAMRVLSKRAARTAVMEISPGTTKIANVVSYAA